MGSDYWWEWGFFEGKWNVLKLDSVGGCPTSWIYTTDLYTMVYKLYHKPVKNFFASLSVVVETGSML